MSDLQVFLGDRRVGTLNVRYDQSLFSFDEDYLRDPNRPTLSQSYIRNDGQLRHDTSFTQGKLPAWFSNLLPEGTLLDYIARKAGIDPRREAQLLAFLGSDLPGAVRIVREGPHSPQEDPQPPNSSKQEGPLRFSLAGVQLKFSALLNASGKLTIPAAGLGGDWIVKLPSPAYPSVPENEVAMLTLASAAGIAVPEHFLTPLDSIEGFPENLGNFAGTSALAVRRFDRGAPGERVHMEDLAQVFQVFPHNKYKEVGSAEIAEKIASALGPEAAQDFVGRLTFIVLTGNGDMHLKNWSFLYPDGRKAVLSPAYDLVSTVPYISTEKLALNLARERSFEAITQDKFRRLADLAGLPERETLATVARVTDAVLHAWPKIRDESPMPSSISRKIDEHMQALPLVKENRPSHGVAKKSAKGHKPSLSFPATVPSPRVPLSASRTELPPVHRTKLGAVTKARESKTSGKGVRTR